MLAALQNYIPLIASEAALCLTSENWQEAKVTALSYSLEFLLYKPGIELLKKIKLADYLAWPGALILNATTLKANREGIYKLKSPYDGSRIQLTATALVELIQHLKPNAVILPQNILQDCPQIWDGWDDAITPFLHAKDLSHQQVARAHGVYFDYVGDETCIQMQQYSNLPIYLMGRIDAQQIQRLRKQGIQFIETNEPANAAIHGQVYSKKGDIDLNSVQTQMSFEPIDPTCTCPTCTQKFTQAYLHHLLQHTPLLCQRFLIQHNVFWMAN